MDKLSDAVLRGLCRLHGWSYTQIGKMARGEIPASREVVRLFRSLFGVPPSAWPIPAAVVSRARRRYIRDVTQAEKNKILRANGRRRRRLQPTAVHEVLDELDWSIADLTDHVRHELGKSVSRASMQFWATGTRQVGKAGESRTHPVQAPLEVRIAVEQITARAALKRRLGERAVLNRNAWPNVEAE